MLRRDGRAVRLFPFAILFRGPARILFKTFIAACAVALAVPMLHAVAPPAVTWGGETFVSPSNGSGTTAMLGPQSVAVDASGNVYVVDNGQAVLKDTPQPGGGYSESVIFAASSSANLWAVAVDSSGTVYVTDLTNGNVTSLTPPTSGAGAYTPAQILSGFGEPLGIAVDSGGNLYIVEGFTRTVWKETLSGSGYTQTAIAGANQGLSAPTSVALDPAGDVYIADYSQWVFKAVPSGSGGTYNTTAVATCQYPPVAIAVDGNRNIFLAESVSLPNPGRVVQVTASGEFMVALTYWPTGLAVDSSGYLYVTDVNFFSAGAINSYPYKPAVLKATLSGALNLGAEPVLNDGTMNLGVVTFFFHDAVGLASGSVIPSEEFQSGGTLPDSCGFKSYTAGSYCNVLVGFFPMYSGTRNGSVNFVDTSGNVLPNAYVYGTGQGPQMAFLPATASMPANGLSSLLGIASNSLAGFPNSLGGFCTVEGGYVGCGGTDLTGYSFNQAQAVAVDGAQNIYVSDVGTMTVYKMTCSGSPCSFLESQVAAKFDWNPAAIALDISGNVYVGDTENNVVLKETLQPDGTYSESTVATGLGSPAGVAVDGSGNVYIADYADNQVLKETPSALGYTQSIVANSSSSPYKLSQPNAVAADGNGVVYIVDSGNDRVIMETPSGGTYTQSLVADGSWGLVSPVGVAADSTGNVYIADSSLLEVVQANLAVAPSVGFGSVADGSSSTTSVLVFNAGNQTLNAANSGLVLGGSSDFTQAFGIGTLPDCAAGTAFMLIQQTACNLGIQFAPVAGDSGTITGSVTLTDNNLNAYPSAAQTINLSGTATSANKLTPAVTFTPAPTPTYLGGNFTVSASTTNTDSSALTYSYVSGPCAWVSGATFSSSGAGSCVVQANGAATTNFQAASAQQTVSIGKATPVVTFTLAPTLTYLGSNFTVSASTTNTDSSALTYSYVSGPCAWVSGATFSSSGAGSCVVQASGATTTNFQAASAQQTVSIGKATPVVTFTLAPTLTYLGSNFTVSASTTNTDSSALTYSYVSGPCAWVSGATFSSSGAGSCVVQASGATTTNFQAASAQQTVSTGKATPAVTFTPAPTPTYLGGNFTVSASTTNTDSSALTYSYVSGPCAWVSGATFSSSGAGSCVVQASGAATTNFQAASAQQTVSIGKATPVVTFALAPTPTYLGSNFTVSASTTNTDSSALTYSYVSGPCAWVSGATFSSSGAGSCVVQANGATTTNFQAASAQQTVSIGKATATVTLSNLTQTYTGLALYPTATTVPSGLSVAWTGVPDTTVGRYAVTATVNNSNYSSNIASGTFVIQQTTPVINWPTPAPITYGTALSATQLDATANTPGTFIYMPPAGTVLRAGTNTLYVMFTPTDRTDYRSATASVTLTVNRATPVITWATPAAIRYGTPLSSSQLNARASVAGSFVYKPGYGTVLGAGTRTLSATFTPADTGDYYNATATVSITVNPALLTVTATNAQAKYNKPLPLLTYTVTGFVNGDSKSVLSGAPSESTTAKQGSLPGTYPITISEGTLSAANYTFKFVNGTLTITR